MEPGYLVGNMAVKALTICIILCIWPSANCYKDLNVMASWKLLEYGFESDADRQHAIDNGRLTNNSGTPIDVDVYYDWNGDLQLFTTIPRFTSDIPYTLATVSSKIGPNGPIIYPYPNYDMHKNKTDCNGIISAFRVAIDECYHMWVIDSGVDAGVQVCPPKLLNFKLTTERLIHKYEFKEDVYTPGESLLVNLVVRIRDPPPRGLCADAIVYVADVSKYGLVVYDTLQIDAWRIENQLMNAIPEWANQTIAGQSFELMDGLFALNLSPLRYRNYGTRDRTHVYSRGAQQAGHLFFHALAAETEAKVSLNDIDRKHYWKKNKNAKPKAFIELGRRGVQSSMEAVDSFGDLYAAIHNPISIVRWNIYEDEYNPSVLVTVADNPEQLQFASGMKVVRNPSGKEELWVSTCRYQKIATETLDSSEINFRILACRIDELEKTAECKPLGTQTAKLFVYI